METFRVRKAQDGSPAVIIGYSGVVVDGAFEREGDLVGTFLQRNAEAAVLDRKSTIGCAAFVLGVIKIFTLGDELPVDETTPVKGFWA